ncbi:P-loop containing nucleoside triphosphate hydrolase protein [Xylariomycetidae sp. FL2044]|nr:P-loop containing nucleoside triphosphate hydrolase protein [Xylariomycetidae sp. FL2044]
MATLEPGPKVPPVVQNALTRYLKLDLTRLSNILAVFAFLSVVYRNGSSLVLGARDLVKKFCTSSVTINDNYALKGAISKWIERNVIQPRGVRSVVAAPLNKETSVGRQGARQLIKYCPAFFRATWFFHKRHLLLVSRTPEPDLWAGPMVPDSDSVKITCLGWSTKPVKDFIETVWGRSVEEQDKMVTIYSLSSRDYKWDKGIHKHARPLDTIHLDESKKQQLVTEIQNYLDPNTSRYYKRRGIPYRRGYLLHGLPGTGKTSLCAALAGEFNLDLYVLNIPMLPGDMHLERAFLSLPARCIVLLEEIDAVGMTRGPNAKKRAGQKTRPQGGKESSGAETGPVTLATLLSALDGATSSEGRIVVMTSNFPDQLDKALLRPGRIDSIIYLGHIDQANAERMFIRLMQGEKKKEEDDNDDEDEGLKDLARRFAALLPEKTFVPAEVQEYLLQHRASAAEATEQAAAWVAEHVRKLEGEEAKAEAEEAKERKEKEEKSE